MTLSFLNRLRHKGTQPIQHSETGDVEPVQLVVSKQKKTCVYFANWTIYTRNHTPSKIPINLVTNIFYSFFNIDPKTGEVKPSDSWADIEQEYIGQNHVKHSGLFAKFYELKKLNRGLKVSMSIGGWSNRYHFKKGVDSEKKLDKFVQSTIKILLEYGFDGVDLDWEYPGTTKEAKEYLSIMKKLRVELRKIEKEQHLPHDSFLVTIASPAFSEKLDLFDISEMDKYISFWNLMTYDFAGSWSKKTGYHSNLYKTDDDGLCGDDTIKYFLSKGVHPQKLILGLANYGRSFANTRGLGHSFDGVGLSCEGESEGLWSYFELPPPGFEEHYDESAVSAYAYNKTTSQFISYDNPRSINTKAQYVLDNGLGGGMWWESSGDNYSDNSKQLLQTFVTAIQGIDCLDKSDNIITAYGQSKYLKKNGLV